LRQVFEFKEELGSRKFGGGFSQEDAARMGAQRGHVLARLQNQRERVRRGEEPVWPSAAFVREMIDTAADRHGIPKEFRPNIKDDAT
jgi:hypothetical protein